AARAGVAGMSFAYPVTLDLDRRRCLVVGGGSVAERKVAGLLDAGARVTVISPSLTAALLDLARAARFVWKPRAYGLGDAAGFALVFVAVDPEVGAMVSSECRDRGIWVNSADDPAHCDFILPAVFRRGVLTVAVSTGGASPIMASFVRDELKALLPDGTSALADIVADVRRALRRKGIAPDADRWRQALDGELRDLAAAGRTGEARARLMERLGVVG